MMISHESIDIDSPRTKLCVWMFNPYGPLPDEGWREYSYVTIGSALADAGHDVIWWTSTFSHHFKTFRSTSWEDRPLPSGMVVRLVPTPGYRSNIGLGRFVRDAIFGWRAYRRAIRQDRPDIIISSEPATMGGFAGVRLARKTGAALVYDQMDLWPELMVQALPARLRSLGQALLWPVYRCRRWMFRSIDGAMALAQPYLKSITDEIPTSRQIPALVVYNGIDVPAFRAIMHEPLPDTVTSSFARPGLKAIFAGSLGPSYDIGTMIEAARALTASNSDTTIYIAGDGPERYRVTAAAESCVNLVYLGKLPPDILPAVYARCDIGLSCYSASSNVEMCDKFYDYTAAGLVLINSLRGEVANWIHRLDLGLQYIPGDTGSLMQALTDIASNPEHTRVQRQSSWDVGMRFDKTRQHAQLDRWIEEVMAARR